MSDVRYFLVETRQDGSREFIRKWDMTAMAFKDAMTAGVMADGLRHAGRTIEVVEIDMACEEPLL